MFVKIIFFIIAIISLIIFTVSSIKKQKVIAIMFVITYIYFWGLLCYYTSVEKSSILVKGAEVLSDAGTSYNNKQNINLVNDNGNKVDKDVDKDKKSSNYGKILGNTDSKIYHVPGSTYYEKAIKKESNNVYFDTVEEAEKAGYRAPKR